MFTGIVQFILHAWIDLESKHLYIKDNIQLVKQFSLKIGDSISIDGICLSISNFIDKENTLEFCLSDETLNKTNLRFFKEKIVNIELPLVYGNYLGGHLMLGHVHQIGYIVELNQLNEMWIEIPNHTHQIEYKGSISINGVSLTIAEIKKDLLISKIRIALIPETLTKTNLSLVKPGDAVNIEFDTSHSLLNCYNDGDYMRLALNEAQNGRYTAPPNPWVGCVIVYQKQIMGKGFHKRPGQDHAEVAAFKDFEFNFPNNWNNYKDLEIYVTLEPCCHIGRTGPCTKFLISKQIKRIIVGVLDPDPRVSGNGIKQLQEAGIQVDLIKDSYPHIYQEIYNNLKPYIYQRSTDLPYVVMKVGLSLDNCYRNFQQQWITSEASRHDAHKYRAETQAIIVGAKTVQVDNPELTVRHSYMDLIDKQPLRVLMDGHSLTNLQVKLLTDDHPTLIVTKDRNKFCQLETNLNLSQMQKYFYYYDSILDIKDLLKYLKSKFSIISCLIEGGLNVHTSFYQSKLVNEIIIYRNSQLINGVPWYLNNQTDQWSLIEIKQIDETDHLERYSIKPNKSPMVNVKKIIKLDQIDLAIERFRQGSFVLVLDDESRENEGDLIVAANLMSKFQMIEMLNQTTGIICVPMEKEMALKLNLEPMTKHNTDRYSTSFTVSVDSNQCGTGVSAKDRLLTIKTLANLTSQPSHLKRPGHVFPLIANGDGLLARRGHTEAAIALCKLANITPRVAVIAELQNMDGTMKSRQQCWEYAQINSIPIIEISQLVDCIKQLEIIPSAECKLYSKYSQYPWKIMCYPSNYPNDPHKIFLYQTTQSNENDYWPVRIHSECFTGDVFKSQHCDCGDQLEEAIKYIVQYGKGIIIFPANHEGRGIGLINKIKAYHLQQTSKLNTFEANKNLGCAIDARCYSEIVKILHQLSIDKIELLTDNPDKISSFTSSIYNQSFKIRHHSLKIPTNEQNKQYLTDKYTYFSESRTNLIRDESDFRTKSNLLDSESPHKIHSNIKEVKPIINITSKIDSNIKLAIVYSSWHSSYILKIRERLKQELLLYGISNLIEVEVPGSNEIPFKTLKLLQQDPTIKGVICVGILIKGDTLHFENISTSVSNGIMQVQLQTGIPIMNCILSCLDFCQVEDRINGNKSTLDYIIKGLLKMIFD